MEHSSALNTVDGYTALDETLDEERAERETKKGVANPPPHWDAEVAARMAYWACGVAYSDFDDLDKESMHLEGWNENVGKEDLTNKIKVHRANDLLLLADTTIGHVTVLFRGTTTLTDAMRDFSFLAIKPTDYFHSTCCGERSLDWHLGLPNAILSCLSPKRPWQPHMHRGFARRSAIHNPYLISALLTLFKDDQGEPDLG